MIKRIIVMVGVGLILIIFGLGLLLYFLSKNLCGDTQINKYKSPDSNYEVNYYKRDCGATTPFVENLELNGQTILRAVTYGNKRYPFMVEWVDNEKISVTTASTTVGMRIYKIQDQYKNIQIIFDEKIKNGTKVW